MPGATGISWGCLEMLEKIKCWTCQIVLDAAGCNKFGSHHWHVTTRSKRFLMGLGWTRCSKFSQATHGLPNGYISDTTKLPFLTRWHSWLWHHDECAHIPLGQPILDHNDAGKTLEHSPTWIALCWLASSSQNPFPRNPKNNIRGIII